MAMLHDAAYRVQVMKRIRSLRPDSQRRFGKMSVDPVAAKSMDASWPEHPAFGRMSGRDLSFLHAKHINRHLSQFGA